MVRRKRKKRKKYDLITKGNQIRLLERRLVYRYVITEIDRKIILTIANNKGNSFMIIYSGVDKCVDTRDNKQINHKQALSELVRLLGEEQAAIAHREAIFRSAVTW